MMIVMKAGATEAEIQSVIDRIETVGARALEHRAVRLRRKLGLEAAETDGKARGATVR